MEIKLFKRRTEAYPGRGLFQERKGSVLVGPPPFLQLLPHPAHLADFEKIYRENAVVNAAINNLTDMIVGVGYYTEADDEKAKKVVDAYAEEVNLDGFLRVVCRNMLVFGFAPVEKWFNKTLNLKPLPPQTVYVQLDNKGEIKGYKQKSWSGSYVDFATDEILWFSHMSYPGNPYGIGLIEPIYSLVEYKNKILLDICKIVHRYASPLNIWLSTSDISPIRDAVEARQPDEDLFIGRVSPDEVQIKTLEMDPRGKYTDYLEIINQEIYEALQAPLLTWLKNSTEASAKVQLEVIQRHVEGIQRYLKRKVEGEIFKPVVDKVGLKEVPRLRWGMPQTGVEKLSVKDVAQLVDSFIIDGRQARELLRKIGLPIEEPEKTGAEKENVKPKRVWRIEQLG